MKNLVYATCLLVLAGVLAGCSGSVQRSQDAVELSLESQATARRMLDRVSQQSQQATQEGRISESANETIQTYLRSQQDSLENDSVALKEASIAMTAKGRTSTSTAAAVASANKNVAKTARALRILEEKTAVIVDFLGQETFSKSEIGALFGTGEFRLIPEQLVQGRKLFRPMIEKLFSFAAKYRSGFRSLEGEIIVTGYSDATPIEPGSRLYTDLARRLNRENQVAEPTSADLNRKLSELRALAVKDLLESIIREKKEGNEYLSVRVQTLGRGEEIPRGLAQNISRDDRRRRVVTFYWVVLPKL
jgi:outer membrane protein OmpA-like peptidoglycan-associated protein